MPCIVGEFYMDEVRFLQHRDGEQVISWVLLNILLHSGEGVDSSDCAFWVCSCVFSSVLVEDDYQRSPHIIAENFSIIAVSVNERAVKKTTLHQVKVHVIISLVR